MPGTTRDRGKPRAQRLAEVFESLQLKTGKANSQQLVSGCLVTPDLTHTYDLAISAGEFVTGQTLVEYVGAVAQAMPAACDTSAAQYCNVLIELGADGSFHATAGALAASAAAAITPDLTAARIAIAVIAVPPSFTHHSTAVTTGMIIPVAYDAGNVSPITGF